jgi:hypothetical protein
VYASTQPHPLPFDDVVQLDAIKPRYALERVEDIRAGLFESIKQERVIFGKVSNQWPLSLSSRFVATAAVRLAMSDLDLLEAKANVKAEIDDLKLW